MENRFLNKKEQILANCQEDLDTGCLVYLRDLAPSQMYHKIKISVKNVINSRYTMNMHAFVYKMSHNIHPTTRFANNMDVSHLCHTTKCMNFNHLTLEPRQVNNLRKLCKANKKCIGHGQYPSCMLKGDGFNIYVLKHFLYLHNTNNQIILILLLYKCLHTRCAELTKLQF